MVAVRSRAAVRGEVYVSIRTKGASLCNHDQETNKPEGCSTPGVMGLPLPKIGFLRYLGPWNFFPICLVIAWAAVWFMKG